MLETSSDLIFAKRGSRDVSSPIVRNSLSMISVQLPGTSWGALLKSHYQILEDAAIIDVYVCLGREECDPSSSGLTVEFSVLPGLSGAILTLKQAINALEMHYISSQQDRLREYTYDNVMQMYHLFEEETFSEEGEEEGSDPERNGEAALERQRVSQSSNRFLNTSHALRFRGDWTVILLQRRCDWIESFCIDVSHHLGLHPSHIRDIRLEQADMAEQLGVSFELHIPLGDEDAIDEAEAREGLMSRLSQCRYGRIWGMFFEANPNEIPHDVHFRFLGVYWEPLLEFYTSEFEETALEDIKAELGNPEEVEALRIATMFIMSKESCHLLCKFTVEDDDLFHSVCQKLANCPFYLVWDLYGQLSNISTISLGAPVQLCTVTESESSDKDLFAMVEERDPSNTIVKRYIDSHPQTGPSAGDVESGEPSSESMPGATNGLEQELSSVAPLKSAHSATRPPSCVDKEPAPSQEAPAEPPGDRAEEGAAKGAEQLEPSPSNLFPSSASGSCLEPKSASQCEEPLLKAVKAKSLSMADDKHGDMFLGGEASPASLHERETYASSIPLEERYPSCTSSQPSSVDFPSEAPLSSAAPVSPSPTDPQEASEQTGPPGAAVAEKSLHEGGPPKEQDAPSLQDRKPAASDGVVEAKESVPLSADSHSKKSIHATIRSEAGGNTAASTLDSMDGNDERESAHAAPFPPLVSATVEGIRNHGGLGPDEEMRDEAVHPVLSSQMSEVQVSPVKRISKEPTSSSVALEETPPHVETRDQDTSPILHISPQPYTSSLERWGSSGSGARRKKFSSPDQTKRDMCTSPIFRVSNELSFWGSMRSGFLEGSPSNSTSSPLDGWGPNSPWGSLTSSPSRRVAPVVLVPPPDPSKMAMAESKRKVHSGSVSLRVGFGGSDWGSVLKRHKPDFLSVFIGEVAVVLHCYQITIARIEVDSKQRGVLVHFSVKCGMDAAAATRRLRHATFLNVWKFYGRLKELNIRNAAVWGNLEERGGSPVARNRDASPMQGQLGSPLKSSDPNLTVPPSPEKRSTGTHSPSPACVEPFARRSVPTPPALETMGDSSCAKNVDQPSKHDHEVFLVGTYWSDIIEGQWSQFHRLFKLDMSRAFNCTTKDVRIEEVEYLNEGMSAKFYVISVLTAPRSESSFTKGGSTQYRHRRSKVIPEGEEGSGIAVAASFFHEVWAFYADFVGALSNPKRSTCGTASTIKCSTRLSPLPPSTTTIPGSITATKRNTPSSSSQTTQLPSITSSQSALSRKPSVGNNRVVGASPVSVPIKPIKNGQGPSDSSASLSNRSSQRTPHTPSSEAREVSPGRSRKKCEKRESLPSARRKRRSMTDSGAYR